MIDTKGFVMKKWMMTAVLLLSVTGCAQQTVLIQRNSAAQPRQDVRHDFVLSGIGQQATIDAGAVCGGENNVTRIETQQSELNVLMSLVTFGIYTPRQTRVFCVRRDIVTNPYL
jgi:hypothetical protein